MSLPRAASKTVRARVPALLGVLLAFAASVVLAAPASAMEALSIYPAWVQKNTAPASAVATIRGIGFDPAATVTFDGVPATVTWVNSRTLSVEVPLSATGKIARVVVANPGGGSDDLYPFIYTDVKIYVSSAGSDSNNGSSPAAAKRTIRAGIDQASSSLTNLVLVTSGRFGDNMLPVPNGTVLAGGYDLTFTTRDPDVNVSEVDSGKFGFNLRSFGLDAKVVVDGLTFINGLRDGSSGGSIEFVGDQVVLSNSVIVGNVTSSMAGGVYVGFTPAYGGRVAINHNVILGNRAFGGPGGGVAIYPLYTSGNAIDVAISDNYIVGNRSFRSRGGGVAFQTNSFYGYNNLSLRMAGNTIAGNKAMAGAGVDLNVSTQTDAVDLRADNNLVFGNMAVGDGGGFSVVGLGTLSGTLSGSTIASNSAQQMAGVSIKSGVVTDPSFAVRDLIVWGNLSGDRFGQVPFSFSDAGGGAPPGIGNISADPLFRKGIRGPYYLAQNDPNGPLSVAVDTGSDTVAAAGNEGLTTATDGTADAGMVDMGMHYPLSLPDSPDPIQILRLDPDKGNVDGTDWVLLRGRGFDPGARVNFGTPEATTTIYISSTRILAQPPPRAAISVNVTVTNPDNTFATIPSGYRYLDNRPPVWVTTVGAQSAQSPLDCVRSVIVDWNDAVDDLTPPVRYEVYKFECDPAPGSTPPCLNYADFIPSATNRVATTKELSYLDTAFTASGADPEFLYIVRAIDSQNPVNRELNLSKRLAVATKNTADTTPPDAVGDTIDLPGGNLIDWAFSRGAVSYRVYRETDPSRYTTPGTLTPLITLTAANNDLDLDGLVDTSYTDTGIPFPGQVFFYKISALDPCNIETTSELLP